MTSLSEAQMDAAHEFANAAVATISDAGRMHPGTVIAATARMGGTYLFRSFGLHLASFPDTQRKLEPVYGPIKDRFSLSSQEAAQAAAVATALLIRHCAQVMDPTVGFGIAVYGFVEGSKTAPDPIELLPSTT